MQSLLSPHGVYSAEDVEGAMARVFGVGVRPLHIERALFEAMLAGWNVGHATMMPFEVQRTRCDDPFEMFERRTG